MHFAVVSYMALVHLRNAEAELLKISCKCRFPSQACSQSVVPDTCSVTTSGPPFAKWSWQSCLLMQRGPGKKQKYCIELTVFAWLAGG